MGIRDVDGFCNGTEWELFMEKNCLRCRKFVDYTEATPEKPVCPIEEAIASAAWGQSEFPSRYIKQEYAENGTPNVPHCTERKIDRG